MRVVARQRKHGRPVQVVPGRCFCVGTNFSRGARKLYPRIYPGFTARVRFYTIKRVGRRIEYTPRAVFTPFIGWTKKMWFSTIQMATATKTVSKSSSTRGFDDESKTDNVCVRPTAKRFRFFFFLRRVLRHARKRVMSNRPAGRTRRTADALRIKPAAARLHTLGRIPPVFFRCVSRRIAASVWPHRPVF